MLAGGGISSRPSLLHTCSACVCRLAYSVLARGGGGGVQVHFPAMVWVWRRAAEPVDNPAHLLTAARVHTFPDPDLVQSSDQNCLSAGWQQLLSGLGWQLSRAAQRLQILHNFYNPCTGKHVNCVYKLYTVSVHCAWLLHASCRRCAQFVAPVYIYISLGDVGTPWVCMLY